MKNEKLTDLLKQTNLESPPSQRSDDSLSAIPIIHELGEIYITLHNAIRDMQKIERFSLGVMMEKVLLECIETCFQTTVAVSGVQKQMQVARASALFDTLKLFIRIAVRIHALQEATYIKLIPRLGEVGKQVGGWMKSINGKAT